MDSDFGEGVDAVRVLGLVAEVASDDGGAEDLEDVHGRGGGGGSVVAVAEEWVVDAVLGDGVGEVRRWSEVCEVFDYCG